MQEPKELNAEDFDGSKLMGWAKRVYDADPGVFELADEVKGKYPMLDQVVEDTKLLLMAGGEEPADSEALLPGIRVMAEKVKSGEWKH